MPRKAGTGAPSGDAAGRAPEKRKEGRAAAAGRVEILVEEINSVVEISGRLVNLSAGGFCAVHQHAVLTNGSTVRFRHTKASGMARVIWNRIAGEGTETGFLVLQPGRSHQGQV